MSQWRVTIGQKQYGPYSLEKLRQIHGEGRVPAEAQVWHPGQQKWINAEQVAELNGHPGETAMGDDSADERGSSLAAPPLAATKGKDSIGDFLAFRKMIAPVVIHIGFWIGAVLASLAGIFLMIDSLQRNNGGGVLLGFAVMLLGPIVVRVICEVLIVSFRMNETLTEIRNELKRPS
jgi:hypothetical protein